jgi:hypothetical protein
LAAFHDAYLYNLKKRKISVGRAVHNNDYNYDYKLVLFTFLEFG